MTVVVPIRNGGKYVCNCIGFLKAQTYTGFEVLFIVDGQSTDDTVKAVEDGLHELSDARMIVQNDGLKLGGNRNLGLRNARGRFIWFLDVDDAPSKEFIEDMKRQLTDSKADFVCCNFVNTGPDGVVKERPGRKYHSIVLGREDAIKARNEDVFPVSTWSKLFRTEFLLSNSLFFTESFAEDIIHTYNCLSVCSSICVYDRPLYAYRQTYGSLSRGDPDTRGEAEIASYDRADVVFADNPGVLKRNALMKIRSSGHMSYRGFMEYARSGACRRSYELFLKGTPEGWWHRHLPTTYWLAIRTYVALVYKRNGSLAMKKL